MTANRGKQAERLLNKHLAAMTGRVACYRLPDAHAGSFTATLADFQLMKDGEFYLLECKSTLHEYRLPHKNVGADQIARMRLWAHAGAKAFVLIYHEALDKWRVKPVDYFLTRTGGSWDLRSQEPMTLAEALEIVTC